jgi:hypothetical protein
MRIIGYLTAILFLISSCGTESTNTTDQNQYGGHSGVTQEVIQTKEYTYLLMKESNKEQWIAVPLMEAKTGTTYYYDDGFEMSDFESKELNRKFSSMKFLERVSDKPIAKDQSENQGQPMPTGKVIPVKKDIHVEQEKGTITFAELYANKEKYAGQAIKIKGKIVKASFEIMGKNWYHIQDGTEHQGNFDLTVTSLKQLNLDDIVIFEGKISLNKDFGYGYLYDILMEYAETK